LKGYLDDQWIFNLENQQWAWTGGSQIISSSQDEYRPSGRYYASSAFFQQKLILFGGETLNLGLKLVQ
jgi:hypothetical protein